ncbi:MAG: ThuA domain-containing protein [Pirellulales bacterium]
MTRPIRVTVWNEFRHEKSDRDVQEVYPRGIHRAIADPLASEADIEVGTATLDEPEHGLTSEVIEATDVLLWWGHQAHDEVSDEVVTRVKERVLDGMGLIVLHSAHFSKIFISLMGTRCSLKWREIGERERLWNIAPSHPIAHGIGELIELPRTEMYGERFDIPAPDQIVFLSSFEGGEVFRSGCTFWRGHGKVFYFRPGHETYPIYHAPQIQQVLRNAVRWARPGV